jgi:hypothetical protein
VTDKAVNRANYAGGAHPQGGRQSEPERSERLARSPAGPDTAAEDRHPARPQAAQETDPINVSPAAWPQPSSQPGA